MRCSRRPKKKKKQKQVLFRLACRRICFSKKRSETSGRLLFWWVKGSHKKETRAVRGGNMDPWELEPFSGWARSGWVLAAQLGSEVPQVVPFWAEPEASGGGRRACSFKMGGVKGAPVLFFWLSHMEPHGKSPEATAGEGDRTARLTLPVGQMDQAACKVLRRRRTRQKRRRDADWTPTGREAAAAAPGACGLEHPMV